MKKNILYLAIVLLAISCKMPGSSKNNAGPGKVYKLRLDPLPGTKYHFEVSNESTVDVEVDDKKTKSIKKTDAGVNYAMDKDSAGNLIIAISYDKIHLYSKKGEEVSEENASNGASSIDPVEKMLALLKAANITATVTPSGDIRSVTGYREIASQMLSTSGMSTADKAKAQAEWQQLIEQGLIKKNMDQLFKIFPDSVVHLGDRWKLISNEKSDVSFSVKNYYTLKEINDGVASIVSTGEISSDTTEANLIGYGVRTDLKGEQQGEYSMDIRTGMLIHCKVSAQITGTLQMAGREIPVKIENSLKAEGQKLK